MKLRSFLPLGLLIASAVLSHTAQAATVYQCKSPQGEMTVSDLPCSAASSTVKQTSVAAPVDLSRRPTYYKRLSPRCQGLYDELNSQAIRRMRRDTQQETLLAWQSTCEQEVADARQAEWNAQSALRQSRYKNTTVAAVEPDPEVKKREQCADMAYGLNQRRARVANSTSATDKADLKQLEEVYVNRCTTK